MSTLTIFLTISLAAAGAIVGAFIYEALRRENWDRPKSILAEFVAVFSAIAIGILISREEREMDRTDTANALLLASARYVEGINETLATDEWSIAENISQRPNVLDQFMSSPETLLRFGENFLEIANSYQNLRNLAPPKLDECGATSDMYVAQLRDRDMDAGADRWIAHFDEYNLVETKFGPDNQNEREKIDILIGVHLCVTNHLSSRIHVALDLYEAICIAAIRADLHSDCVSQFISDDPAERDRYTRLTQRELMGQVLRSGGRFVDGVNASQVYQRYSAMIDALRARREKPGQ